MIVDAPHPTWQGYKSARKGHLSDRANARWAETDEDQRSETTGQRAVARREVPRPGGAAVIGPLVRAG